MTSHRIGVNLRVSGNCDQGARKYMEDNHVIKFLKKDTDDYEFAYFGIFDGHGGPEASAFCRDNLLNEITKYDGFWTNDDDKVLCAIRKGFLDTHNNMWNVIDTWPKTATGLQSTAGSTATVAIIKQGKLYTGHVGDSGLVMGENDAYSSTQFPVQAICVTKEHKPDDPDERLRIEDAGGEVINKSGVPRVVWHRPKTNHKGPIRRSTQIDQIPFLAVARSLGDLWSYDYTTETYVVSPDPDVAVQQLDPTKHRCLILASDGLWNMLTPEESVHMVMDLEQQFEQRIINDPNVAVSFWSNPAERLVARALNKWRSKALKADNTSSVVVLIDPLGPSKLTLLKRKRQELLQGGELTPQVNKSMSLGQGSLPTLAGPTNTNANCSLNETHLRVTDQSMIRGFEEREGRTGGVPLPRSPECHQGNDSVNDSVQYIPVAREPRHSRRSHAGVNTTHSENNGHKLTATNKSSDEDRFEFTRLVEHKSKMPGRKEMLKDVKHSKAASRGVASHKGVGGLIVDEGCFEENVEVENDSDEEDDEEALPEPPPSTPCERDGDDAGISDTENSDLHSSADVTDVALLLASDESLGSPESSREEPRPRTPLSAPAKLSSSRGRRPGNRHHTRRKLVVKPGKKVSMAKPPSAVRGNKSSVIATGASSPMFKVPVNPARLAGSSPLTRSSVHKCAVASTKTSSTSTSTDTSSPFQSPPRGVLNNSRSMNDASSLTPKNNRRVAVKSLSCTGLTPEMGLLMTDRKVSEDISTHFYPTLRSKDDNSMVVDADSSMNQEPLKQLNKTGPLRKNGSKRWGNFFRTSKLGLDNIFHHTGSKNTREKRGSVSTGKLQADVERASRGEGHGVNTSMSTGQLRGDVSLVHLPDVTVSSLHADDMSADDSAFMVGDMTNLSACDTHDSSMLSAAMLGREGHHSMLEDGVVGHKAATKGHRRSFLSKTRVTLSRARKAAKKAFFPENHRLFHNKTGVKKRKSDEFLPTPDLKKRRHIKTDC